MKDSVVPATGGSGATGAPPAISYVPWTRLWEGFEQHVADLARQSGAVSLGELGGGANPTLGLAEMVGRPLELTVLDISPAELERTPPQVQTLCVDLCADEPPVRDRFDLVFSRMLCEHVRSGRTFHRNCLAALRPGGYAVHFFPSATALPFMLNRILPTAFSERLVEAFFPARRRGGKHAKFPARYSWCFGPTPVQVERFRSVGFEVVSSEVGIGHGYYDRIPPLRSLERAKSALVLRHPSPWLAAYVIVVLRRPTD
ncbi:MAG: class I SAM-dependent methyltransferase [Acidimicrobiales bacterium]